MPLSKTLQKVVARENNRMATILKEGLPPAHGQVGSKEAFESYKQDYGFYFSRYANRREFPALLADEQWISLATCIKRKWGYDFAAWVQADIDCNK